jgi:hypothetical protein
MLFLLLQGNIHSTISTIINCLTEAVAVFSWAKNIGRIISYQYIFKLSIIDTGKRKEQKKKIFEYTASCIIEI